ncbi:MAG: alpha/beta hydrolase [Planctomycetes bacterium]|nr:alpha/beta hydrolase [Planctomycetota bacterium]
MSDEPKRPRRRVLRRTVGTVVRILAYGLAGSVLMLVAVVVVFLDQRPDLEVWHTVVLDQEFTEDTPITSFDEYLALEDRLFAQLQEQVYAVTPAAAEHAINRYQRGSLADPARWSTDWNRTFVLEAPQPKAGVLLLHGMSDSPYSMRSLGERLHEAGANVIAMRVPGHGAAPSGLVHTTWQDMAAAVVLAVQHLRAETGDRPLYVVGYSHGGALAVEYALTSLTDEALPAVEGIVLMSPAIGITRLAALAVWQDRLGRLLRQPKLAWNSISPEIDPFKYSSFALNAGKQTRELTLEIQSRITDLQESGKLDGVASVLAFQSAVDATVSAPALVNGLFQRLPSGDHELVEFDVNRLTQIEHLLKNDPRPAIEKLLETPNLPFGVTLVTNSSETSRAAVARRRGVGATDVNVIELGLQWPERVYSLSHVALPFRPDDMVYGGPDAKESPGIQLGNIVLRGERGALLVNSGSLLRIHWNPFHEYVVARTLEFMELDG